MPARCREFDKERQSPPHSAGFPNKASTGKESLRGREHQELTSWHVRSVPHGVSRQFSRRRLPAPRFTPWAPGAPTVPSRRRWIPPRRPRPLEDPGGHRYLFRTPAQRRPPGLRHTAPLRSLVAGVCRLQPRPGPARRGCRGYGWYLRRGGLQQHAGGGKPHPHRRRPAPASYRQRGGPPADHPHRRQPLPDRQRERQRGKRLCLRRPRHHHRADRQPHRRQFRHRDGKPRAGGRQSGAVGHRLLAPGGQGQRLSRQRRD